MEKQEGIHILQLLDQLQDSDREKFTQLRKSFKQLSDYVGKKRGKILDNNIEVTELEYEVVTLNIVLVQLKPVYNNNHVYNVDTLLFKHVPELNQKHEKLLKGLVKEVKAVIDLAKNRIEAKKIYAALHSKTKHSSGVDGSKNISEVSFLDYLTDKGATIYPMLQEKYRGTRPIRQVYLIKALEDFEAIKKNCELEMTAFHEALINSFGGTWSREAYRKQFDKMSNGTSSKEEAKISTERRIVKKLFEGLKVAD